MDGGRGVPANGGRGTVGGTPSPWSLVAGPASPVERPRSSVPGPASLVRRPWSGVPGRRPWFRGPHRSVTLAVSDSQPNPHGMNKKQLSERDICTKFITPAVRQAGWNEMTQLREEVSFTKGRIIVRGKMVIRHMRQRYVKTAKHEERMQRGLRAVEKKQLPHMLCVTNMLLHGIYDPSFVRHDNTLARPYISYTSSDRVDIVLTNPPFGGKEEDGIESNFPKQFQTRETADLFLALIIRLLRPSGRAAVVLPDGTLFGEGVKTRLKEHLLEECNLHTIVRLPNSVFKPYASIGTNLLFFEKGEPTGDIWFYEHRVPAGQKAYSMTKPIRIEHLQPIADWWGGAERKGRVETEVAWRVTADEVKARGYNLDFKNPHTVAADHGDPEELLQKLDEAEREIASLREQLKAILAEALLR
jgi:N-6 DNA Methylase